LFHKKALLTDTVNRQLDDLEFQQVKAYMNCRVAIATKDDFDLTPANRVQTGSETETSRARLVSNSSDTKLARLARLESLTL
jgi:hypothetical protein